MIIGTGRRPEERDRVADTESRLWETADTGETKGRERCTRRG